MNLQIIVGSTNNSFKMENKYDISDDVYYALPIESQQLVDYFYGSLADLNTDLSNELNREVELPSSCCFVFSRKHPTFDYLKKVKLFYKTIKTGLRTFPKRTEQEKNAYELIQSISKNNLKVAKELASTYSFLPLWCM